MKYLGCAYYPEYWGPDRYETDARLMREAGINIARIGEFAWAAMEPEEGRFTFDWLHQCVETLGRQGIEIVMCTPTAAPPAWLTAAYPDTLLVRGDGTRAQHGSRRHYCSTSDTYRRHTARIVDALSRAMARHANVTVWQLDNEFGPEAGWCHCEGCQARFQTWLRERYGTLDALNRAWRTGFWSLTFSDWRQIRLDDARVEMYSSQKLDSRRFWSDMMIDYARSQTAILRRNHPAAMVATNGMGPLFTPVDYYKLFDELDVACDDLYFDIATMDANAAAMNVYRGLKPGRRYWITETGSGALDHNKPPTAAQFRAWAWSNWAHGGDAHFVFRWRTCLSGHEQELQGILEHSGAPRHRYRAVQECFREIAGLRERLKDLPLPQAPVALLFDYDTAWAYEASRVGRDVDYPGSIYRLHAKLYERNILADILPPDRDLTGHALVIVPSLMIVRPDVAERLRRYVQQGGVVLATGQAGMRDACANYLTEVGPQHLRDLLGVRLEGGMYLNSHVGPDEALWVPAANRSSVEVAVSGTLGGSAVRGSAKKWIADLELHGGAALLQFDGEAYQGQPAVVETATGRGLAYYAGAVALDDAVLDPLLDHVLAKAGVPRGPAAPRHVEVVRRGSVTFVVNHTDQPAEVTIPGARRALVGALQGSRVPLPPYGVAVLEC
jgi:beta-galactosidase